jgi:chromosome segregation ATPase
MEIALSDPDLRRIVDQAADSFKVRLLEKSSEQIARLQKIRGEEEMKAQRAQTELDQARTELAGVKNEIEALRQQKNDAEAEITRLSKQRTELHSDVQKLKEADKRYRETVEKELKHLPGKGGLMA